MDHEKKPRPKQTPPDIAFAIKDSSNYLIKMVGVGNVDRGNYLADTEYWYSPNFRANPFNVDSLTMEYQQIPSTGPDIDTYFSGMASRFTPSRINPLWHSGAHLHTGVTSHLFSMDDPDATSELPRNKIGVLFEIDGSNHLVGVVFHKLTTGQIWDKGPPGTGSEPWTLSRVKDASGAPSTDPNDIPRIWLNTVMGS